MPNEDLRNHERECSARYREIHDRLMETAVKLAQLETRQSTHTHLLWIIVAGVIGTAGLVVRQTLLGG